STQSHPQTNISHQVLVPCGTQKASSLLQWRLLNWIAAELVKHSFTVTFPVTENTRENFREITLWRILFAVTFAVTLRLQLKFAVTENTEENFKEITVFSGVSKNGFRAHNPIYVLSRFIQYVRNNLRFVEIF